MTNETNNLTIDDVLNKVDAEEYRDDVQKKHKLFKKDHVFDENETVKWNREKVVAENEIISKLNDEIFKNRNNGQNKFYIDLRQAIVNTSNLNFKQADCIYSMAWEEGHSDDYRSVAYLAEDLLDLVLAIEKNKD